MQIYLRPGLKYLGFFHFLKLLLRIKYGRGGIAYVNFILRRLNFHDYLFDNRNKVRFKVKYNDLISMSILKSGCYEKDSLQLVLKALQHKPGLFIDIGANFGLYTIYASKIPGVKTIAIDGLSESFSLLLNNIEANQLRDKVTACNLILSSRQHFAFFGHHDQGNLGSSRIKNTLRADVPNQYIVDTTTLDGLLEFIQPDYPVISLIKMDIEGQEYEVLKNSTLLEKSRPSYLLVEMLDDNENFDKIIDFFKEYQYIPYNIYGTRYETGVPIPESNLLFIDSKNLDSLLRVYDIPK